MLNVNGKLDIWKNVYIFQVTYLDITSKVCQNAFFFCTFVIVWLYLPFLIQFLFQNQQYTTKKKNLQDLGFQNR